MILHWQPKGQPSNHVFFFLKFSLTWKTMRTIVSDCSKSLSGHHLNYIGMQLKFSLLAADYSSDL